MCLGENQGTKYFHTAPRLALVLLKGQMSKDNRVALKPPVGVQLGSELKKHYFHIAQEKN
jgi:hypothetical protein